MPIIADHQQMQDVAGAVVVAAEDTAEEVSSCRAQLVTLTDVFQGATAVAFEERYEEWNHAAAEVLDALAGLGRWLQDASAAFDAHDAAGAQALRG